CALQRAARRRLMLLGLAPGAGFGVRNLDDLDRYLGAVADAGFGAVSLNADQLAGEPQRAARLVERHGLCCTDVLALLVTRDDDATMAGAEALRPAVDALGPSHVLTMMRTRPKPEALERLVRIAELLEVALALEFAPGPVATVADALAIAEELGPRHAGILADTYHFFRAGSTWEMLETVPAAHLPIVQFDDALPAEDDDYMRETTERRAWPGEGELQLGRFAATLRERGWDGVVSVEVLSQPLRRLPVEVFARRAYETAAPYWT
ncbi:MAG: sugar phosphate isomerase/epimerase, partial [Acidimicrobiaceae bacterium]|nr:sugar phosphate isomerase/epimerase [Acidimicrobiaceae bacterium]